MTIFGIPIFPEQASVFAKDVDALYFFLLSTCALFAIGVSIAVIWLGIKYHKTHDGQIGARIEGNLPLELLWSVIPTIIAMFMFGWGASVYYHLRRPPDEALHIYAVGKQWMWKFQHLEGQREINELHLPAGQPVKVTISSEDVLHSYFIPEFRVKADVVPGRYNVLWFTATKPGTYKLFCAEYCGTKHSGMIGSVIAMEPENFQNWLAGGAASESPVAAGEKLFQDLACSTCHTNDAQARGPVLTNLFGQQVQLQNGGTALADEAYIRESIVSPQAKVVAGFQPIMPTFQGLVSEEQLLQLIAYVKSLSQQGTSPSAAGTTAPQMPQASDRPAVEKQ